MARDRPAPDDTRSGNRSAGACPPRALHGKGQALALRYEGGFRRCEGGFFLTVARGLVLCDVRWQAGFLGPLGPICL